MCIVHTYLQTDRQTDVGNKDVATKINIGPFDRFCPISGTHSAALKTQRVLQLVFARAQKEISSRERPFRWLSAWPSKTPGNFCTPSLDFFHSCFVRSFPQSEMPRAVKAVEIICIEPTHTRPCIIVAVCVDCRPEGGLESIPTVYVVRVHCTPQRVSL